MNVSPALILGMSKIMKVKNKERKEKKKPDSCHGPLAHGVSQGLLYRWTEHSILPISTRGGLFNPNNATQNHSIFVRI
jgi:hypothetical protein